MAFTLVKYAVLKKNIVESIKSLARYYHYNNVTDFINAYLENDGCEDPSVWAKKYTNIPAQRRSQIGFLLTVSRCLDDILAEDPESLKQCEYLLNATGCYVREIISHTYDPKTSWSSYWASFLTSVDESRFFRFLGSALGLNRSNKPSDGEALKMYHSLKEFILVRTYKDPNDPKHGYIDDPVHEQLDSQISVIIPTPRAFSEKKIEGFVVEDFIKELIGCISKLEQQEFDNAKEKCQRKDKTTVSTLATTVGLFAQVDGNSGRKGLNECSREENIAPPQRTEHEIFIACMH